MSSALLCLLLFVTAGTQGVVGGGVGGVSQGPPRDPRMKPPTGTGSITGRITAGDTGAPIRRAVVNLSGAGGMRVAYTDHEGRYQLSNLAPGTYSLMVNPGTHRAGYEGTSYGGTMAGPTMMRPKPIELADGQKLENVDIVLPRSGVITGRVTDLAGEPIARVTVGAWLTRPGSEPMQVGGAQTDDLGQFRLFSLRPGDYLVVASPQMGGGGMPSEVEGEPMGFAQTWAPGTPVRAEAMRVRVTRGGEVAADIRLAETRVYSIKGTLVTSKGDASRTASIMVMQKDATSGPSFGGGVMPDGSFVIRNVPPGSYEVIGRYNPPVAPGSIVSGPMVGQEFASVQVDVGASDVDGVLLALRPGATVTGAIVFDDTPPDSKSVGLYTQAAERRMFMSSPQVEVKSPAFTLRNVFGPVLLRGSVGGAPGWALKAVLLRGKDITDEPTTLSDADSGHLQVVFTSKAPTVEGVVTDETGKPVTEAMIVFFGADPATWVGRSSYTRTGRMLKDGKYMIPGLREGRFFAAALAPDVQMNLMQATPEFFEALSKVATAVTLNPGEKRQVDLTLTRWQQ